MATCEPLQHNYQDGGNVIFCTKCGHMIVKSGHVIVKPVADDLSELLTSKCAVTAKAETISEPPLLNAEKAAVAPPTPQLKAEKVAVAPPTPQLKAEKAAVAPPTPQLKAENAASVARKTTFADIEKGDIFVVEYNGQQQEREATARVRPNGFLPALLLKQVVNNEWTPPNGIVASDVSTKSNKLISINGVNV